MQNISSLTFDELPLPANTSETPEVNPVLILLMGSTSAELAISVYNQRLSRADTVPHRVIVVDSLPYGNLVARFEQLGYSHELIEAALPRANYFELSNPFNDGFDFDAPLNREWNQTIHEPSLKRIASKPDSPGCAGSPALGRARVEANEQDLRLFFEQHLQELTQIRAGTLALREGVMAFFITTGRGGTGTGASGPAAAILRSVLNGSIHFVCLMPCIFGGDDRARANALAMLREIQHHHRFGGSFPMKGGKSLKSPYDSVTTVFASNGAVTLLPIDAIAQESAILSAYLSPRSQSAFNSRYVDLTDVIPHDLQDKPMHVRVTTAASIRTLYPGVQEYLACEWTRQEVEALQQRFEQWCKDDTLTEEEEGWLAHIVEEAKKELGLTPVALLRQIDAAGSANTLRTFLEQVRSGLAAMKAEDVKRNMAALPARIKDEFSSFERGWSDRARQLALALPGRIVQHLAVKLATAPHLAVAALARLQEHLTSVAVDALKAAEREKKQRDEAGRQLGEALAGVQNAGAILGLFKGDEVARDAANAALNIALMASVARVQQQSFEYLAQALQTDLSPAKATGRAAGVPSAVSALHAAQLEQIAKIRRTHSALLDALNRRLEELGFAISRRSAVFQRTLIFDGATRDTLNRVAGEIREKFPQAPAILKLLEGAQDLAQTVAELLPLLPLYAESCKNLTQTLLEDPAKLNLVVQLLRNRKPFTPIDREVEDQQGLSGQSRRDRLVILEVPGGQDGPLAEELLRQKVVEHRNQIVDSVDDEIRLFYVREGLPYAAIKPLKNYKERHDHYLARESAITPYTTADAQNYPDIEASKVNLRMYTEALLYKAKAVLPDVVLQHGSGRCTLRYEKQRGEDFTTEEEKTLDSFEKMVVWLAKHVDLRKALQARLLEALDANPAEYKTALLAAWRQSSGVERDYLQEELFAMRIDPLKFKVA